jgi:hypothetical protein
MATPLDNAFTKSVNALVAKINDATQHKESLFEQAEIYFQGAQSQQHSIAQLEQNIEEKRKEVDSALNQVQKQQFRDFHNAAKKALKDEMAKQARQRNARLKLLTQITTEIIQICEGKDWQETQLKSAKVLATLLLLCPREGNNVAKVHQAYKPLYKAVLSLRLLDQMLKDQQVENEYIVSRFNESSRFSNPKSGTAALNIFQRDVAIPLISAALIQDVGMQHPEIQRLLKGSDGSLNPFRVLEKEVRVPLLIMNHEQTTEFALHGLGEAEFTEENDDSPAFSERKARFNKRESNRARLLQSMLNNAVKPNEALGSVLKAAQIYTSIVLSTKPNFDFADLPKATKVVLHSAQKGALLLACAQALQIIVGHFPMGFGVVFCRDDTSNTHSQGYSFAIVNALNPARPNEPKCRVVTTVQNWCKRGAQMTIPQQQNLYFEQAYSRFSNITSESLKTMAEHIASELNQPAEKNVLPRCWSAHGFFHFKKQQNLWPATLRD